MVGGELWKWSGTGNPMLVRGNGWGTGAANYQVNPAEQDVSIWIDSDRNIVAERPMYFNCHGWATGGHDTRHPGIRDIEPDTADQDRESLGGAH